MQDPVTNRYTEALFRLAKARGVLQEVAADVRHAGEVLASPAVHAFIVDARVSQETRRDKLSSLLQGMHPLTRNFVNLLFDKRREEVLTGLAGAFHRRMLDEEGAAEGVVESARPLDPSEVDRLATAIGARLGRRVTLESRVVPELLGGARLIVGSRMLDGSIKGRLEGLRTSLLSAPLPSIAEA